MRETMKNLIKNTITSIGIALTVFCVTGMVFDIAYDGNFSLDNYQFSKMVIGCIIVGLGFGLPTMIYHKDNLPMPFKIIIHMDRRNKFYPSRNYCSHISNNFGIYNLGRLHASLSQWCQKNEWKNQGIIDLFVLRVCRVTLCNIEVKTRANQTALYRIWFAL